MAPRRLPSGRWQGVVRVPGSARRKTAAFGLRRDAAAWEEETRAAMRRGDWRDPQLGRALFEDWAARWLAARHVEPETAAADRRVFARHVLPRWSGWPLAAVGRLEVQSWVTGMTRAGLGQPTVLKAYNLFAGALGAAVDEDLLARSPCRRITLPARNAARLDWWTPAEVELILAALGEPYRTVAALMCWCGLRWEEAAGLAVGSVSWLRREVTVYQVVTSARRVKRYAKTAAGNRTVRMEDPVPGLLLPHWEAASGRLAGTAGGSPLLVPARGGRPMLNKTWGAYWRAHVRGLPGVPYHPPHTLRHSGASWLAQAGVPLGEVGRWLGHGPTSGATAVYAHLCPERGNATVGEALASLRVSFDSTRSAGLR